ncbi:hypothetical protein HYH02_000064 [Chlamydomonas schloesseri]|uniref:Pherophorin domain-containing protein n=1 Tax=Chlamydomonas schloesseri TaxID=2026947 RepID=A0A836B7P3_9CHLO|nr:hypothetical protein HYH02_000064 [Chlamydomonas schloesseri]|eukprot:KAG2449960.1 hypothetical protein HYH02_000064 [Chlamydomonas schloesseri]
MSSSKIARCEPRRGHGAVPLLMLLHLVILFTDHSLRCRVRAAAAAALIGGGQVAAAAASSTAAAAGRHPDASGATALQSQADDSSSLRGSRQPAVSAAATDGTASVESAAVRFEDLDEYDQYLLQLLLQEHAEAVAAGGPGALADPGAVPIAAAADAMAETAEAEAAAAERLQQSLRALTVCGMPHHWDYGADADEADEELCWGLDALPLEEPPPPLPPRSSPLSQYQLQPASGASLTSPEAFGPQSGSLGAGDGAEGGTGGGGGSGGGGGRALLQITPGVAGRGARNLPISVIVPIQDFGFDCSTLSGLDACAEPQCLNFFSLVRSPNNSVTCQQVAPIRPPGAGGGGGGASIVVPYDYDLLFQFGNSPVLAGLSLGAQSLGNLRFTTMINQFPAVTRDNTNTARVATTGGSFQAYEGVLQRQRTSGTTGSFDATEPLTFTVGLNLGTTADTWINRLSLPGYSASERGVTAAGAAGAGAAGGAASDARPSVAFGLSSVILGG